MNDLMNAPRRRRIGSETQVWEPTTATSYSVTCQIPVVESKAESLTYNTINSLSSTSDQNSEMTCRDRTNEFIGAVKSLQGRQGNGLVPHQQSRKIKGLQQWTEFMRVAKLIGKDLSSTYTKLEKLAILARKKTLFDDKPLEIQELTYIIKQDINSLNKQISQLQELVRSRQQQNGRHMQSHSNSVVVSLQSKLALMSNEFKQVLEVRTENLKHQRNRREHFSQGPVSSALPVSATSGYHHGSVLLADERSRDVTDVAINMDQVARPNSQYQSMLMVEEQDTYLQSRADTMQNIETTIVELGGIFQQLAHMVKEQEEMIQRIDANVEDVQMNVEGAHGEILKYFQSVTSNRWLMIKVFGVLIIFFILFVVFMA